MHPLYVNVNKAPVNANLSSYKLGLHYGQAPSSALITESLDMIFLNYWEPPSSRFKGILPMCREKSI